MRKEPAFSRLRREWSYDTKPIEAWQHPVDDHDVVVFARGKEKPVATVWRMINNVPMLAHAFNDMPRHHVIIFDQEKFHVLCMVRDRRLGGPGRDLTIL